MCLCLHCFMSAAEDASLQHDSGRAGPQSCLSHVPSVAMTTRDCNSDTHSHKHKTACTHTGKNIFPFSLSLSPPLLSPRSSPAAERCNRNTEEPACLSITQHWHNAEDARREERTEGGEDIRVKVLGRIQQQPGDKAHYDLL